MNEIKSIYTFTNAFENYLIENKKKDIWVYSRKTMTGSLLLNNLGNDKKIILKLSDSINPIGGSRLEKFIENTETFKGRFIDNYVYIAYSFKDNAIRLAKVDKRITLITVNCDKKEVRLFGSMNIDLNILNHFIEFSDYIGFSVSYDFEGLLKHQGFKNDKSRPIVEIQSRTKNPKVFFSYSWDNESHKLWTLKLASDLIKSGIDVLIDEWDLDKYNNDLHFFMETGIRESDKVIMICTPEYARKSNERLGGVGVENTIITGEFYDKDKVNKYIPIARKYRYKIHECLPTYLKSKYVIDFVRDDEFKNKLDELVRKILNVPKYKKPELGNLPKLESNEI